MKKAGAVVDRRFDRAEPGYTVSVGCLNCGWQGTLTLSKGTSVPTKGTAATSCPNCECRTLGKTFKQGPML